LFQRAALESALGRIETRLKLRNEPLAAIDAKTENNVALISIRGSLSGENREQPYRHWRDCRPKAPRGVVFCFDTHAAVNGPGIAALVQMLSELEARQIPAAIAGLSNNFR
jgi:hypothetical protein